MNDVQYLTHCTNKKRRGMIERTGKLLAKYGAKIIYKKSTLSKILLSAGVKDNFGQYQTTILTKQISMLKY